MTYSDLCRLSVLFLYSSQNCLRVTTGSVASDRPVNVFVDSGSGYVEVSTPGKYYGQGATVIDQCFDTIVGVQVSNQSTDTWAGVFELSTDGKATYVPLICSDCTGTTNTMPIVVDGNDDATELGYTTWCFGGAKCTLTVNTSTIRHTAFCICPRETVFGMLLLTRRF